MKWTKLLKNLNCSKTCKETESLTKKSLDPGGKTCICERNKPQKPFLKNSSIFNSLYRSA